MHAGLAIYVIGILFVAIVGGTMNLVDEIKWNIQQAKRKRAREKRRKN